jgi:predicted permease
MSALIEELLQDVRYAWRGFRRTPGYALSVAATIAIGLGLNTAFFTAFNAYVLRPLSVRDPYSLYRFTWATASGSEHRYFTWRDFEEFRDQNRMFTDLTAAERMLVHVEGHILPGSLVTANHFQLLSVGTMLGRPLLPGDREAMVLSFAAWRNKFASDPAIIGRRIVIHGVPLEVVGVASESFTGLGPVPLDFWAPIELSPRLVQGPSLMGPEQPDRLTIIGRLRAGWSPRQAEAALTAWARGRSASLPAAERPVAAVLHSEATKIAPERAILLALSPVMAAFGLVLFITCANVANMMLARVLSRQREIGVRLALGAARPRLVRQLLTESLLLALGASAGGLLVSKMAIDGCQRLVLATMPGDYLDFVAMIPLGPDWRVFAFMLAAAVAAALLFGLAPALQATRANVMEAARGDFTASVRPARLRNLLVVVQVAVSMLVLVVAAVLLRTNRRLESVDPGLATRGVVEIEVQDNARPHVLRRLAADPDVEALAAASKVPFFGLLAWVPVIPEGSTQRVWAGSIYASPEYFTLYRLPIVRGRGFTADEARAGAPVAVISEATARRLWPVRDAIGRSLRIVRDPRRREPAAAPATLEIVGIARDAVNGWIGDGRDATCIFLPRSLDAPGSVLFARVRGDARAARARIDSALALTAPGAVDQIHAMDDVLALQRFPFQMLYWASTGLGILALALTLSGIYGVLAFVVTQRTKEIGIRVALGAGAVRVARLVLGQSLRFALVGAAAGSMAAWGTIQAVVALVELPMFGGFDGAAYAFAMVLVLAAAAGAACIPARRAAGIDPNTTLRCE